MAAAAAKRGVQLTSRSRPLKPEDFARFRHVVCMEADNVRAVETAARYWEGAGTLPTSKAAGAVPPRVSLMTDWAGEGSESRRLGKVPDPYYGGAAGFDKVLDLLDEAAEGLLDAVLAEDEAEERQRAAAA
jgi:protein-tyrosine phosphatase